MVDDNFKTRQEVHIEVGGVEAAYLREYPSFPFDRDGLHFTNANAVAADWLVWPSFIQSTITTTAPRERRVLVVTEPNGYFPAEFHGQFGILVSPFPFEDFRGDWLQSHGALPAFLGLKFADGHSVRSSLNYETLLNLPIPQKSDTISAVVSRKSILPGHRKRLRFVSRLADAIGPGLDVYGRGFRDIEDKAEAILPSKYHLVLENTVMPSYWTEKLADAWLGHALPIVSGAADLTRWFPEDSFLAIDIDHPDAAIEIIGRAMRDDLYAKSGDAVAEARHRILSDERLCQVVGRVIAAHPSSAAPLPSADRIHPQPRPPVLQRVPRELARIYWQMASRIGM